MTHREEFLRLVADAADAGRLLAMTLSRPLGEAARTTVRPVQIAGSPRFQLEWPDGPQTRHENLTADELAGRLDAWLPGRFGHAHAFLADADLSLLFGKKGRPVLQRRRPSKSPGRSTAHDRDRRYIIPGGTPCEFLVEAGVMRPDGRVPKAQRRKFRQINRFLELISDIAPELPVEGTLRVVDFGSGKSHLTFALHHLLTSVHGRDVEVLSVDRKESVVANAEAAARRMNLAGITHRAANIADIAVPTGTDLAVWLHACDTATDDAIAASVRAGVAVILAVPCCQHELNAAIDSDSLLFQHGLLRERTAAIATDALRAAALERLGYRTQVLEFIDLEHTAKNVLIRAIRRDDAADQRPGVTERYHALKATLGITTWHLERRLPQLADGAA